VDPKELRRKLGLSEAATDAEVDTKLSEVAKLGAPSNDNPDMAALAKLAENNPVIKTVLAQMEETNKLLKAAEDRAKLAETQRRLSELTSQGAKVSFSAATLNEIMSLMTGAPAQFGEKLFAVLKSISDGSGVTTLGETGSSGGENPGREGGAGGNAEVKFNEAVDAKVKGGTAYADAVEQVAREQPQMYADYRKAVYIPADA